MATRNGRPWKQMYLGGVWYPFDPRPQDVKLPDIVHALSLTCRFGGACKVFYSTAEHSVRVARLVMAVEPEHALSALLHDAHEAYPPYDVPRPVKYAEGYAFADAARELEQTAQNIVRTALRVPLATPPIVKWADATLLATERRDLMMPCEREWEEKLPDPLADTIEPWSCRFAKLKFSELYARLNDGEKRW